MANPIPIVVIGAAGRMGRLILECACAPDEDFTVVGAVESAAHPQFGKTLNSLVPTAPAQIEITDSIPADVPAGAVAINFTDPEGTTRYLEWSERTGNPMVIGTSGLSDDQVARLKEVSQKAPVLLGANMSVGVNVLFELVGQAVKMLGPDFDVEITEMHHRFKKDAPSGTANRLLDVVRESRGGAAKASVQYGREGFPGERSREEIGMHSQRGGDVVGDHTVTLATLGERIELTHRAHTRETFARGALRAARWISGRNPGFYSMKDVLGL